MLGAFMNEMTVLIVRLFNVFLFGLLSNIADIDIWPALGQLSPLIDKGGNQSCRARQRAGGRPSHPKNSCMNQ